jgi:adenylate kinase
VRLILLGPPGAGKGTQAGRLAARLGVPAISTGDIFRANIRDQTELGRKVSGILASGALVPDDLTDELVCDRLRHDDVEPGFLLDGYPRNAAQVQALDAMLADGGHALDAVVQITAEPEELVRRLLGRAHVEGRDDDTEDVIRHRQQVYLQQTAPLVDLYGGRGLLVAVNGMGEVDEVTGRLVAALNHA